MCRKFSKYSKQQIFLSINPVMRYLKKKINILKYSRNSLRTLSSKTNSSVIHISIVASQKSESFAIESFLESSDSFRPSWLLFFAAERAPRGVSDTKNSGLERDTPLYEPQQLSPGDAFELFFFLLPIPFYF